MSNEVKLSIPFKCHACLNIRYNEEYLCATILGIVKTIKFRRTNRQGLYYFRTKQFCYLKSRHLVKPFHTYILIYCGNIACCDARINQTIVVKISQQDCALIVWTKRLNNVDAVLIIYINILFHWLIQKDKCSSFAVAWISSKPTSIYNY